MDDLKSKERELDSLIIEEEAVGKEASIAQKRALIEEAKAKYGKNWKKVLGIVRSIKPDMNTVHDLYGMGLGDLRDYNDPSRMRRR